MEITVPGKQHTHLYVSHKTLHLLYKYCTNVLGDAIVYRLIFSFPAKKKPLVRIHTTIPPCNFRSNQIKKGILRAIILSPSSNYLNMYTHEGVQSIEIQVTIHTTELACTTMTIKSHINLEDSVISSKLFPPTTSLTPRE